MTKKSIAFLIESELEKAEVVLAARSMTDAIQKMAETAAKMEAEDLMPLSDPVREHFGPEAAQAFNDAVATKLRDLVQTLSETKNAISDEIARMQGEQVATASDDLASMDDDALNGEPEEEAPAEAEDSDAETSLADFMGGDEDAEAEESEPRYSDTAMGGNSAGRVRKESAARSGKALLENADRVVASEYASLIREGKNAKAAAKAIMETYGVDIKTLIDIIEAARG